jgi:hypothetical protein
VVICPVGQSGWHGACPYRRRYQPQPSTCFIITDPKRREIFEALFRDRIVHHLVL